MLALSMECIRGDHGPGEVQGFEQRRELGDLIGLAVQPSLPEATRTC